MVMIISSTNHSYLVQPYSKCLGLRAETWARFRPGVYLARCSKNVWSPYPWKYCGQMMVLENSIDNGHLLYFVLVKSFTVHYKKPVMYTCCRTRKCDVKEATTYNNRYKSIYTINTIQNRYTPKAPYEFDIQRTVHREIFL